jgi:hypothetical protein
MVTSNSSINLLRGLRVKANTHKPPVIMVSAKANQGSFEIKGDAFKTLGQIQKSTYEKPFLKTF